MMKTSLKDKLYNLITSQTAITYGQMCDYVAEEGYKVSTGERKLRDLYTEKKIDNVWKNSKRNRPYICGYKLPSDYVEPVKQTYQIVNGPSGPVVIQL